MSEPADVEARDALRRQWRVEGRYPATSIGVALAAGARDHGSARLVFSTDDGEDEVTLAELHHEATTVAAFLSHDGIAPGDAVLLQAPTSRASVAAAMAVWHVGAVLVPVTTTVSSDDLALIAEQTGASTAIVDPLRPGAVDQSTGPVDRVLPLDGFGREGAPAATPVAPVDPSSVACVLFTSGSTAAPKGVRHSHETLLAGLTDGPAPPPSLMTFPAGHVAALLGLVRPLIAGGTTVVMDRWSARRAAALIERHRLVVSAGTPFFLTTLLDEADGAATDISSLSLFLVGAATVPPALVSRAEARGIITWRTYGSTEHPAVTRRTTRAGTPSCSRCSPLARAATKPPPLANSGSAGVRRRFGQQHRTRPAFSGGASDTAACRSAEPREPSCPERRPESWGSSRRCSSRARRSPSAHLRPSPTSSRG